MTLRRSLARLVAFVALLACAVPALAQSGTFARGKLLALGNGYVAFTSGAVLRLAPGAAIAKGIALGSEVRVTIDAATGAVRALEAASATAFSSDAEVADLPARFFATPPGPAPSALPGGTLGAAFAGATSVTIDVRVPASTQPTDDVYLSTDRSGYSPAEIRMTRIDAERFTVTLALPANDVLHYEYTRGSFTTVERTRVGGIAPLRTIDAARATHADDVVTRWADDT